MINERFYEYNDRFNYERSIAKHLGLGTITENDARLIRWYLEDRMDKGKIKSPRRANSVGHILVQWRKYIGVQYENLTLEELLRGKREFMNNGKSLKGRQYAQNSQRHMVKVIKTFTNFLIRKKVILPIDELELREIEPPEEDYHSISPEEILSPAQINEMLALCKTSFERAIIALLYETGCRVGELGSLTWGDFIEEPNIWQVRIDDRKTRKIREEVYMVTYLPYLVAYRNDQVQAGKDDFVLLDGDGRAMSYPNLKRIIRKIAARALHRQVDPKLFRTSRITNMIIENYPSIVICKWMWGQPYSNMLKYYEKLASREVKKIALRMAGLSSEDNVAEEKIVAAVKPVKCVCGHVNPPGSKFCSVDGRPLTGEAVVEEDTVEETFARLMDDDAYFDRFCERRKQFKAKA